MADFDIAPGKDAALVSVRGVMSGERIFAIAVACD
jgi:hypothetical protein